jgi:hypothetical protein
MATTATPTYTTRPLDTDTWADFAWLVEANNGVWGGCWCMGFHPEGLGKDRTASQNRRAKREHARKGTVHQVLSFRSDAISGPGGRQILLADPAGNLIELVQPAR